MFPRHQRIILSQIIFIMQIKVTFQPLYKLQVVLIFTFTKLLNVNIFLNFAFSKRLLQDFVVVDELPFVTSLPI